MTAEPSINPAQSLHEQLEQASPDLMRDVIQAPRRGARRVTNY